MITTSGPARVLVAVKPVDLRKGMDGLAALVKEELKADPFGGVIYVFRAMSEVRLQVRPRTGMRKEGPRLCS